MTFNIDNIDPKFVDVDFRAWNAGKGFNGHRPEDQNAFRGYEDSQPMLSLAECQAAAAELDKVGGGMERMVTRVFNQGREGSCVGNAGTQAHQVKQAQQFGKSRVTQLSAVSLYQQIGRSPSSGAMVDDALEKSSEVGILPLDTPENRTIYGDCVMQHTGFYNKKPSNWTDTAKKFRVDEWFVIRSLDGLLSALLCGHPIVVGRQGHSILYLRPIFKNGRWNVLYVNSWGSWGVAAGDFEAGFGLDTESQIRQSASWCYAACSVVSPFAMAA